MGDEIQWAAQNGDVDILKSMIEKVDINAEIKNGRQLLHIAADYGQREVVEFLLSKGAEVNGRDKHGMTPIMAAIFEGHTETVKALLEGGADKTVKAPSGESLMECAEKDEIKDLLR